MTTFMDHLAHATLPVAIVLLVFAGAARAVLWAQVDDVRAQRVARQYLEPLATWCVVAVAAHVLALGASGGLAVMSLALPFVIGTAAMLLRAESAETEAHRPAPATSSAQRAPAEPAPAKPVFMAPAKPAPAKPAPAKPAPAKPAPAKAEPGPAAPAPSPAGSLWAGRDVDESTREGALWSR